MRRPPLFAVLLHILVFVTISSAGADNLWTMGDEIYETVNNKSEALVSVRIFNGTHQFGIAADDRDPVGVVVIVNESKPVEVEWCWRNRFTGYDKKFFVLIPLQLLNREMVSAIRSADCIAALLLYNKPDFGTSNTALSQEASCPNAESDLYRDHCKANEWNSKNAVIAEGFRDVSWNQHVMYLGDDNSTSVKQVRKCHDLFNSDIVNGPFCAASYEVLYSAAGNTEICHRRTRAAHGDSRLWEMDLTAGNGHSAGGELCAPVSGTSLVAFLPPTKPNKTESETKPTKTASETKLAKYMIVATRMDSYGLVPEVSPGDISVVSSQLAMLTAARMLNSSISTFYDYAQRNRKYVWLTFFDAEHFDYTGSSSMAYLMDKGEFPHDPASASSAADIMEVANISQIEYFLEVQQIGAGNGRTLYAHVDASQYADSTKNPLLTNLTSWLKNGAQHGISESDVVLANEKGRMPPSSWYSFARYNVTGLVLASFNDSYQYSSVHSMADQWIANHINEDHLKKEVKAAASAIVYAMAQFVGIPNQIAGNMSRIDNAVDDYLSNIFKCLLGTVPPLAPKCDYLDSIAGDQDIHFSRPTYTNLKNSNMQSTVRYLLYATLGTTQEAHNIIDKTQCMQLNKNERSYRYSWHGSLTNSTPHCFRSSVFEDGVTSPAFEIEGYDFTSGKFPSWTESYHSAKPLKLFLLEADHFELSVALMALASLIVSFLIVGRCSESVFVIDEGDVRAEEGEPL